MSGTIEISCSISYLRHLVASPEKVEALLALAKRMWNGVDGGPAYGYGHIARILSRPVFDPRTPRAPGKPLPWEYIKPPEERAHAVPVAYAGNDIDGNLASHYCLGRGIKGAFWANFLSATHVAMADGEEELREEPEGDARRSVESWRPPRGRGQHSPARRQCGNLGSLRESCTPRFNPHFCHAKRPRRTNAACWVTFIENGRTTGGPMDRRNAFLCKPYSLVRSKKGCWLVSGGPQTLREVTGTQRAARGCPLVEEAPLARTARKPAPLEPA